jgi:molybdopterin converting factor small subunit
MRILLFGMIAEKAGTDELEITAPGTFALRQALAQRINGLDRMSYALAVDRTIVNGDVPLDGAEEIAVLPPFAGG